MNDIALKPLLNNNFELLKPYTVFDIEIPAGYQTNGANIPRIFWSIVPPFKPKYLPAVIVHDFLCHCQQYKKADDYFKTILLKIEDSLITRSMARSVRLYHLLKYKIA